MWHVKGEEAALKMYDDLLQDPGWSVRAALRPHEAHGYAEAVGVEALPSFVRRHDPEARTGCMFPQVKSKCADDDGRRTCTKKGHSCWRRILDHSSWPYRQGWRIVARAVRGALAASKATHEVFSMQDAARELRSAVSELAAPGSQK